MSTLRLAIPEKVVHSSISNGSGINNLILEGRASKTFSKNPLHSFKRVKSFKERPKSSNDSMKSCSLEESSHLEFSSGDNNSDGGSSYDVYEGPSKKKK